MKCAIINFYGLSDEWRAEAKSNLGEYAEEELYLEPFESANPNTHVLWDLSEAIPNKGNYKGFEYNASICISNNSSMLLKISDDGDEADFIYA